MAIPVCKDCGNKVIYDKPKKYKKFVLGREYTLQVCQECLLKRFPTIKNLSRIFNTNNEVTCYAFNIPIEEAKKSNKKYSWTKEKAIEKYGEEKGLEIWNNYCEKQSKTNTFEYKKEKYGWTLEQFDEYNQSRAVTLENLIKRHGEERGNELWKKYCIRQSETKSWDWIVENYGIEKAREINSQKALTLKNFIRKYGEDIGKIKWEEYITSNKFGVSKISQYFFSKIDKYLGEKYTTYYDNKNYEFEIKKQNGSSYFLDYFIKELNICIEFNGSCFHGDERLFEDDEYCNPFKKDKTAKELREIDEERYKYLYDNYGIKTFVMWESDFNKKRFDPIDYINNVLKIEL